MRLPRPLLVALAGLGLAWTLVILAWPDAVIGLTFDDAFYYFEIGLRLSRGEGSTFDGVHLTNGYHPLWVVPCALAHLVAPPGDGVVRGLLLTQLALFLGGIGLSLAALDWRKVPSGGAVLAAVVLFAWLAVPMVTRTAVNGLESALVVAVHGGLLALTLHAGSDLSAWSAGRRWAAGGLLCLALYARTDGALLTPILLLWALPDALKGRRLLTLVPVGIPPTVGLAVFLAGNQWIFDTPMQVSGSLKRVPPGLSGGLILAGCALASLGVAWLARSGRLDGLPHVGRVLRHTGWHLVFGLVIVGYYTGLQTFARQWYFAPIVAWVTLAGAAGVLDLAAKARSEAPDRPPLRTLGPLAGILALPLLACGVWTAWQLAAPDTLAVRKADRAAAVWLGENLPQGTRVAAWDAGLIGYVTEQPIVNLDGVVNDVDWLHALRAGTAGQRLVQQDRVGWVVNHSVYEDDACVTIDEALERLGAPPAAEIVATWKYEQVGRLNGGEYARHPMATCVVRLAAPPPTR